MQQITTIMYTIQQKAYFYLRICNYKFLRSNIVRCMPSFTNRLRANTCNYTRRDEAAQLPFSFPRLYVLFENYTFVKLKSISLA